MATASVWTGLQSEAWANKRGGAKRASKLIATKAAAQAARKTGRREKVAHSSQAREGGFGERGYRNDQRLSKG